MLRIRPGIRPAVLAISTLAAVQHAQAGDGVAQLVNRFSSRIGQEQSAADTEYAADGKMTLAAAKRIMQGRTKYDLSVYVYLIADRADEIDWASGASEALDAQIGRCQGATQNRIYGVAQLRAQEKELAGDGQVVAGRAALLGRQEASLSSQASYECRGVYEASALRKAKQTIAHDPLKD